MTFNKKNLHSPHDGLFKHLMSDISLAKEFLTHHLPSKIKQAVDLNHLMLCQNRLKGIKIMLLFFLKYLLGTGKTHVPDAVIETIHQELSSWGGHDIMGTVAEYLVNQYLVNQRKQECLQEGILKGIQQGREEGIQQGIQEGEVLILIRQLERKFGDLPIHYRQWLKEADSERLLDCSERLLEANSLEELFDHD